MCAYMWHAWDLYVTCLSLCVTFRILLWHWTTQQTVSAQWHPYVECSMRIRKLKRSHLMHFVDIFPLLPQFPLSSPLLHSPSLLLTLFSSSALFVPPSSSSPFPLPFLSSPPHLSSLPSLLSLLPLTLSVSFLLLLTYSSLCVSTGAIWLALRIRTQVFSAFRWWWVSSFSMTTFTPWEPLQRSLPLT